MQQLTVKAETALIRPFVVACILRGVKFDPVRYDSFIDLQVRCCYVLFVSCTALRALALHQLQQPHALQRSRRPVLLPVFTSPLLHRACWRRLRMLQKHALYPAARWPFGAAAAFLSAV